MQIFHYALKPSGALFLRTSESLSRHRFFTVLDNKHRLFQRRDDIATALPSALLGSAPAAQSNPATAQSSRNSGDSIDRHAREMIEKHAPACVVIDHQQEIIRFSGGTGRYIERSQGAASLNLFGIVRKEDLLPAARDTVRKAIATRQQVIQEEIVIAWNGQNRLPNLIVEPMAPEAGEELYLVAFQDCGLARKESVLTPIAAGWQPEPGK